MVVTAFHCVYRNGYPAWKTSMQALYHDHWIGKFERCTFSRASAVVAMTTSAEKDFVDRFELPELSLIHGWVGEATAGLQVKWGVLRGRGRLNILAKRKRWRNIWSFTEGSVSAWSDSE
jgi:hypothetical protein